MMMTMNTTSMIMITGFEENHLPQDSEDDVELDAAGYRLQQGRQIRPLGGHATRGMGHAHCKLHVEERASVTSLEKDHSGSHREIGTSP